MWLYWAGRAYEALNKQSLARERYALVASDYLNSYYGRLAVKRLPIPPPPRVFGDDAELAPPPANEPLVRTLLSLARYDEALSELRYAQRSWGDSPAIQATIAWTYKQQGLGASGSERFRLLRGSITTMRRAYPQFLAAGGQGLPREVLTVIFPLAYWDVIRKYSAAQDLDPYLVAALVVQESTFVPDVRSSANAVGLMQLMAATGRQYARRLKLPYSARLLTNPDANLRMGTTYFADKVREFGSFHLALASYNAGERAVRRWMAERPEVTDQEEFIDDIPYPETQNYVKRILGTVEDYRRLYGS
jgi:soluble lytic murein transglycosylase